MPITRHLAARVSGTMLPRWAYPVVMGPLRGTRFILGSLSGGGGGASVYFNRIEPEQTALLGRTLRKGGIFMDVGANVGYYSLLAAKLVGRTGRVLAFEPEPRNLDYLNRHVSINRLDNIEVLPVAVSSECGTSAFTHGTDWATGSLSDSGDTLVATVTLDKVVEKQNLAPDIVKIDVEGAEYQVLVGARNLLSRIRPILLLSTHSADLADKCLSYVRDLQYDVNPLVPGVDEHEFIAEPRK